MKKILSGWKHIKGVHCGSVAIRDICNYYGHNLSEELCFGLGGGLGFYYSVNESMSPTRSIHVRGPGMEANFFNNFGLEISDWKYEDNNEKAFIGVRNLIDNDIPVLIQTDIYYLDYYNSSTHFPGHIVVVCGYDDEKELFYLADSSFEELQTVSYNCLKNARSSKAEPYPLSNNWLEIDISRRVLDLESAVPAALVRNAKMMYRGHKTLRGLSGVEVIKEWADDLPNWKSTSDWKWCSRYSYQVIGKRGVEGAGFRWFYRDFLEQSLDFCLNIKELGLIERMDRIGQMWFDISSLFKQISESEAPGDKFTQVSLKAREIFTVEKKYYSTILNNFK